MKKLFVLLIAIALLFSLFTLTAAAVGETFEYSIETAANGKPVEDLTSLPNGTEVTVTVSLTCTSIADGETYEAWGVELDIADLGLDYISGSGFQIVYEGETTSVLPSNYVIGGATGTGMIRFYIITTGPDDAFTLGKTVSVSARYTVTDNAEAQVMAPTPIVYMKGDIKKAEVKPAEPVTPIVVPPYIVTLDAAGGVLTGASVIEVEKGASMVLPGPVYEGYVFGGWSDGANTLAAGSNYTPSGDVTLTATWTPNDSGHPDTTTDGITVRVLDQTTGITAVGVREKNGDVTVTAVNAAEKPISHIPGGLLLKIEDVGIGDVAAIVNPGSGKVIDIIEKSYIENGTAYVLLDGPATVRIIDNAKRFADVSAGQWFNSAVVFASSHELFQGVSTTEFAPSKEMTRGMLVTVLWRLEGKPEGVGTMFDDVPDGLYYSEAVRWAAGVGVVNGYGDGTFLPDENITREQLAAVFYRYLNYLGYDTSARAGLNTFSDGAKVSGWAIESMKWSVASGVVTGRADGTIDPQGNATRAEVATLVMRIVKAMVK